jgi:hypothetical protein
MHIKMFQQPDDFFTGGTVLMLYQKCKLNLEIRKIFINAKF